jgi:hypothetical protein
LAEYESILATDLIVSVTTISTFADFGSGGINGEIMQIQVVPEPSTLGMIGAAAIVLLGCRLRRRDKA